MFKIPVVKNCPVTRASQGRVTLPPWLIADIVGTLEREKGQEWLILLHGSRSEDGFEVVINSITIPKDQKRHSVEVELGDGDKVDDVIGVLHSHHSMSARFSTTDDTKLNPRFDISIVVSENLVDDESTWLGFSYEAEGGVKLPCGAKGRIGFVIQPEGVEDWPLNSDPVRVIEHVSGDLGDCCHRVGGEASGRYIVSEYGKCGFTDESVRERWAVFGQGTDDISKALPPPVPRTVTYGGWKPKTATEQLPGYASTINIQEDKGWDNFDRWVKCDNCGFYEMPEDMEALGAAIVCKDCIILFEPELEPIVAGSPYEEDVEWAGREAQLLVKEYGGGL